MCLTFDDNDVQITKTDNNYEIKVARGISEENLIAFLDHLYNVENKEDFEGTVFLRLNDLTVEQLAAAFKFSLGREDLKDPLMILNIINLIKIYNTLDESFFEQEDIYFSMIDDFLDVKLLINKELKEFSKKVGVYFISLFKSFSKTVYDSAEDHVVLPNIYRIIFLSSDIMTLCGIFSKSGSFNTSECVEVYDSMPVLTQLLMKNSISVAFFDTFAQNNLMGTEEDDNKEGQ